MLNKHLLVLCNAVLQVIQSLLDNLIVGGANFGLFLYKLKFLV